MGVPSLVSWGPLLLTKRLAGIIGQALMNHDSLLLSLLAESDMRLAHRLSRCPIFFRYVCPRTHGLRNLRHDALNNKVEGLLRKEGYWVAHEPHIRTETGLRQPDVVAENLTHNIIFDSTVVADIANLDAEYDAKVAKYDQDDIRGWTDAFGARPGLPTKVIALVCSWRGVMARRSVGALSALGITLVQPHIPTSLRYRIPDLVATNATSTVLLDTTIVGDKANLNQEFQHKVIKYPLPDIQTWLKAVNPSSEAKITLTALVLNWRGAVASATINSLKGCA